MNQAIRRKLICERIAQFGACSTEDLVERCDVSAMTIRRDLQTLADERKVIRTHGGATLAERVSFEFDFLNRVKEHQAAKEAIAAVAAAQVEDGESVMLDSGTTTLELAKRLRGRHGLTVITSSLPIAAELQYDKQIEVLLLGGRVRASSPDLAGALTEANLETLHANVAFLGAAAIDRQGCVYQESAELARMVAKMAASAERVFIVANNSKLGTMALWRFGQLSNWTALITDAAANRSILGSLRKVGVHVIKAD